MAQSPQSFLDRQFGAFLKRFMREHDLSFSDMAKRAGISDASIHRLINGGQGTSLAAVEKVLTRLDANLADIFPNHVGELTPGDIKKAQALRISRRR